eukprot:TRINITY_DN9899_c0_g1_i1.p1 TRINITY_DN9899_c0_g1~~TRINITY_DN9899_c0_g1_i1.p1  ORF type:complete len:1257 (+),score=253.16 TRINITY_DN9899_c0_g1_i1:477-3773(+)
MEDALALCEAAVEQTEVFLATERQDAETAKAICVETGNQLLRLCAEASLERVAIEKLTPTGAAEYCKRAALGVSRCLGDRFANLGGVESEHDDINSLEAATSHCHRSLSQLESSVNENKHHRQELENCMEAALAEVRNTTVRLQSLCSGDTELEQKTMDDTFDGTLSSCSTAVSEVESLVAGQRDSQQCMQGKIRSAAARTASLGKQLHYLSGRQDDMKRSAFNDISSPTDLESALTLCEAAAKHAGECITSERFHVEAARAISVDTGKWLASICADGPVQGPSVEELTPAGAADFCKQSALDMSRSLHRQFACMSDMKPEDAARTNTLEAAALHCRRSFIQLQSSMNEKMQQKQELENSMKAALADVKNTTVRLQSLCGADTEFEQTVLDDTLGGTLSSCSTAVSDVESLVAGQRDSQQCMQDKMSSAAARTASLGKRLHHLSGRPSDVRSGKLDEISSSTDLESALTLCEAAAQQAEECITLERRDAEAAKAISVDTGKWLVSMCEDVPLEGPVVEELTAAGAADFCKRSALGMSKSLHGQFACMSDLKLKDAASTNTLEAASLHCRRSLVQLQSSVNNNRQQKQELEDSMKTVFAELRHATGRLRALHGRDTKLEQTVMDETFDATQETLSCHSAAVSEVEFLVSSQRDRQRCIQAELGSAVAKSVLLGKQLHHIAGCPIERQPESPSTLDAALTCCQAAVTPLEDALALHLATSTRVSEVEALSSTETAAKERAESLAKLVSEAGLHFGEALHSLLNSSLTKPSGEDPREIIKFCEMLLPAVQDVVDSCDMANKRAAAAEAMSERDIQARKRSEETLEAATRSLIGFSARLREIAGGECFVCKEDLTLESCVTACESALEPLRVMRDEHRSSVLRSKISHEMAEKAGDIEAKAKLLKLASLALGRQMYSGCMLPADVESCSWEEGVKFCHEAVSRLQALDDRPESSSSATHAPFAGSMRSQSSLTLDTALGQSLTTCSLASWSHGDHCAVCSVLLGKRRLKPRHHCRICGKTVCSSCSPNFVQVQGYQKAQRACTGCLHDVQQSQLIQQRLVQLAKHLDALGGAHQVSTKQSLTLADTVELCEQALLALMMARK